MRIFRSFTKLPHEVLGLSKGASKEEIKKRYYDLARTMHPDVNPSNAKSFQDLTTAYHTLMNSDTQIPDSTTQQKKPSQAFRQDFLKKQKEKEESASKASKPRSKSEQDIWTAKHYIAIFLLLTLLIPLSSTSSRPHGPVQFEIPMEDYLQEIEEDEKAYQRYLSIHDPEDN